MTQTADPGAASPAPAEPPARGTPARVDLPARRLASGLPDVCPYLLAGDGSWRSGSPDREHTCAAILPPAPLAPDKQRRLCLSAAHRACATFLAAEPAGADAAADGGMAAAPPRRSYPRTAPVVLDHGHVPLGLSIVRQRSAGQLALVGLMVAAFGAIAVARLPAPDGRPAVVVTPSTSPSAGSTETPSSATPSPSPTPVPSPTPSPTSAPSPTPTPTPTPDPSPTPAPSAARTYTVQPGDTLSGIAARHGTTVRILADLNGIEDPSRIRIGTVLVLP